MTASRIPAISVTMAAYNVAPFVGECLDSVLGQEFADFELIIVDDASQDGTFAILQDYAERDPRIRLLRQERNQGLSVARNIGIAQARGEWVTFLDADDLFSPAMLRRAIEKGRQADAQMVLWDYAAFTDQARIAGLAAKPSSLIASGGDDRVALLDRPAFAWTRMVRRDALERLDIAFAPGLTYQDVPVHWQLVTQLDTIAVVPERLAFYRQQPAATTAGKGIKRADYFHVLDLVEQYLIEAHLLETYADVLTGLQLNAWHGVYDVVAPKHRMKVRAMIDERFEDRHRAYLAAGKPLRWQARAFFRAREGNVVAASALAARNMARALYRRLGKGG
ncbi:glycosyltransferase family 2 protein [Alteriqipengyuania lutimaris]|uniref:Glycosyltransferase family 2 protein n=1 Tax=Alteriqipengyuania lutimaris TaxID=1538146 RepID=A0A395LMJ7_9SPHN|nr:glycosyltransferase family 2 protein [Alteriqipengyuania lutimaris]MBB3034384.1 glycosyltransferase involved in cell wall biosynthesis [Alteriqipengyuania lutimaris]RDS76714.1 glycosyltransferase family 2 protein [Alteriqipengyuania lutimaris]